MKDSQSLSHMSTSTTGTNYFSSRKGNKKEKEKKKAKMAIAKLFALHVNAMNGRHTPEILKLFYYEVIKLTKTFI